MNEQQLLQAILDELRSSKQQLGFSHPPKARYIYANRQYSDALWYFWNGAKSEHEPIEHHALTGIIEKIEIEEREFRGKPDYKVNLHIRADRAYVIQSGFDTLFAKGLLFTLSKIPVEAFRQPITIAVEAGDTEQVLFCRIYNPATGQAVFAPYDENANWNAVAQRAIAKVQQAHTKASDRPSQPVPKNAPEPVKRDAAPINDDQWAKFTETAIRGGFTQLGFQYFMQSRKLSSRIDITIDIYEELLQQVQNKEVAALCNGAADRKKEKAPASW